MRRKRANISRGMLFTWGMLTGLVFLFAVPQKASDRMQLTYARMFRWPLAAGHGLTLTARPVALPHGAAAEEHNQDIQTLIANLQAELRETQRQNEVLTRLRATIGETPTRLASVIGVTDQGELFIGRGKDDGLTVGQFVMSPGDQGAIDRRDSVIGTISSVDAKTAKVRLITAPLDPKAPTEQRIAVSIGNLGFRALLEGRGGNTARIPLVEIKHKVNINTGDPVYVQKSPGLDAPVIAARITRCERDRDNPMFCDITVEPVCHIAGLREVAVLIAAIPAQ